MLITITSSLQISVAIFALIILHISALDAFPVAVYEHAVILPNKTETLVSQDNALFLMNENIEQLSTQLSRNNFDFAYFKRNAQMTVTPKDVLYGWKFSRETISLYLKDIPAPQVNWITCQNTQRYFKYPHCAKNAAIL
uniref:Uncharacterized protein n=1 Tax=Panthera tigris altaica TaxID=74533 RepID=A0A8C9MCQ9_PANTA